MREPLLYLEQPETVVLGAFHIVVIEDEAGEAAVFGQDLACGVMVCAAKMPCTGASADLD